MRGALIGSGVGAGVALAADFGAGTLGSAAKQLIGTGRVSVKESLKDGLINAVTGRIYGNDKIRSLGEALGRGAAAGGVTSGINYLSDALTPRPGRLGGSALSGLAGMMLMGAGSGAGRDPRRGCGTGNREVDWIGERMAYGYQYGVSQTAQKKSGFNFADFAKEIFVGAVTGGLASAAFYGAGKAVQALAGSIGNIRSGSKYVESLADSSQKSAMLPMDMNLQFFGKKSDIKQVEQVARQLKMTANQRRAFGDYIESLKTYKRNDVNFSWKELMQIAESFMRGE